MLEELRVRDLGVIADIDVFFGPGLTVITGETGAGKTLVVDALELAMGGRADTTMVRHGAEEARVEARFTQGNEEFIFVRSITRGGRSRAELNDKLVTLANLEASARSLVDIYGQHDHQSLVHRSAQRAALDSFAGVDLASLLALRRGVREIDERLASLGGDEASRLREMDFLRFELEEITAAGIASEDEDAELAQEELRLASAVELKDAAWSALVALGDDNEPGALDLVARALDALDDYETLAAYARRAAAVLAELEDARREIRVAAEGFEEDPVRLEAIRERRATLHRLARKHGGSLAEVLRVEGEARSRVVELEGHEELCHELESAREALLAQQHAEAERIGDMRRAHAPSLGVSVESHLAKLAFSSARFVVSLAAEGLGDDVEFLFSANPGEPPRSLAKIASGGEIARTMLALRLVCREAPATLLFDEVDVGVGGAAALAVGRALAELASDKQVLVVTHLAQVAAHADQHLVVEKADLVGRVATAVRSVEGEQRVIELSRLLSGQPDSRTAREHASELLEASTRRHA